MVFEPLFDIIYIDKKLIYMNIDKKKALIIVGIIILILLFLSFIYFLSKKKTREEGIYGPGERTLEQILREDLTAPTGTDVNVPKEVINKLTAPKQKKNPPVPDNIIKSLTAPSK